MERRESKWGKLKDLFGFKGMVCCGSLWSRRDSRHSNPIAEDDDSREVLYLQDEEENPDLRCHLTDQVAPATEEMNLATALAAERRLRAAAGEGTAVRASLMRLLEEEEEGEGVGKREGGWCCVCMGREKGAAFIPCGHTFCRVCSRELQLNRGSCPLCNRPILEILDIF